MKVNREVCCICSAAADWVCVRTPNAGQLDHLCDHHFQSLRERNPILGARYEMISQPYMRNNQATIQYASGE
jgi:hypothetical protein